MLTYPYFQFFPRTDRPPAFVDSLAQVFASKREEIDTVALEKGLSSNAVLGILRDELVELGFQVESGHSRADKLERPVFFGAQGQPTLRYQIDAFHPEWRCGVEVEAGRAMMGNAVYRDLVQAMVMVDVDVLALAVPNSYKFKSLGRKSVSRDFEATVSIAEALFGHSRFTLPYRLLLIGY